MNWYGFTKNITEYRINEVIWNEYTNMLTTNKYDPPKKPWEVHIDLTHGQGVADNDLKQLVISKPEMEVEDDVEVEHVEDPVHRQPSCWNLIKLKVYSIRFSLVWFKSIE